MSTLTVSDIEDLADLTDLQDTLLLDPLLLERVLRLEPRDFVRYCSALGERDRLLLQYDIRALLAIRRPEAWCREYLPAAFPLPFGPHHHWLMSIFGPRPSGLRAFAGAPRGSGKTSVALFANSIRVMALGSHRYIVIVAVDQTEADSRLGMIAHELLSNDRLVRDYPALKVHRYIEGTLELKGGRIEALGAGVSVRGLVRRVEDGTLIRPQLFLFDDLETPEQARSKLRTDRLEEWLMADVSNLGGPGEEMTLDVVGVGTTLEPDALASRALRNAGRFRGWTTERFPAEYARDGLRAAAWIEGQPLSRLNKLLDPVSETFIGRYTYAKEYLLDPMDRDDTPIKRAYLKHKPTPPGLQYVSLGIDPAASEADQRSGDYSAMVEVGIDAEGYVRVTRAKRGWWSKQVLFDAAEEWTTESFHDQMRHTATIAYEAVAGFRWGLQELQARHLSYRGVTPRGDKLERFQFVGLMYEAGVIIHDPSLQDGEFEAELLTFPTGAHDDYVDALIYAVALSTNMGRRNRRAGEERTASGGSEAVRQLQAQQRLGEERRQRALDRLRREEAGEYD